MIAKLALAALICVGLWGGGSLSYKQYLSGEACPILGDTVPACYVAFAGYILMSIGALLMKYPYGRFTFWAGIAMAGGLAFVAVILESTRGGVCPRGVGGVASCYYSFAVCAASGIYFRRVTKDLTSKA